VRDSLEGLEILLEILYVVRVLLDMAPLEQSLELQSRHPEQLAGLMVSQGA
jgi:hypothetical protein